MTFLEEWYPKWGRNVWKYQRGNYQNRNSKKNRAKEKWQKEINGLQNNAQKQKIEDYVKEIALRKRKKKRKKSTIRK